MVRWLIMLCILRPGQPSNPAPCTIQGNLAHTKQSPPRTLQYDYAQAPMAVLGGERFLVSVVPLYGGWGWMSTFMKVDPRVLQPTQTGMKGTLALPLEAHTLTQVLTPHPL